MKAAESLCNAIRATDDAKTRQLAIIALSNPLSTESHNQSKVNAMNALALLSEEGVNISYAMDAFSKTLNEGDRSLKKIAAWAIGNAALNHFDVNAATGALAQVLEKGDEEVQLNAAWARQRGGNWTRILPALPAIARVLSESARGNSAQLRQALCVLQNPGSREEAIHALAGALSSYDASWKAVWVAKNAVNAGIDLKQSAESLSFALENKNVFIRQDAAETLYIMAEKDMKIPDSAKAALENASQDEDPDTKKFARLALQKLAAQ
jgi:hypothetical protein